MRKVWYHQICIQNYLGFIVSDPFRSCLSYLTNSELIQFTYSLLGFEKIAYVSGSSTLTTHPSSLDQSPLRNTGMFFSSKHNFHFYVHSFDNFFLFFRLFDHDCLDSDTNSKSRPYDCRILQDCH